MKKVIITLLIVVLVLGIGTGGALFWGYSNAKTDKAYASKANTLVSDYEKKYGDKWLDKNLTDDFTNEGNIVKAKEALGQAKTDAQNSLNELNATKSSKRVASVQKDAVDYFNITIKSLDNAINYYDYTKALAKSTTSLESSGGQISSLAGAAAELTIAKNKIDTAISELEKVTPPDTLKEFHTAYIAELKKMSAALDGMIIALNAGDLTMLESYTNQLGVISAEMVTLDIPSADEITKDIISTDDQKKLDEIPGRLSTEASKFNSKTFSF